MDVDAKLIESIYSDHKLDGAPTDEKDSKLLMSFMKHLYDVGLLIKEPKSIEIKTIDMYENKGQKRCINMEL